MPDKTRAVESGRSRVVLLHDGEMAVDTAVIHSIPVPPLFSTGKADRTITIAVACDPPVRRQRREYTAGHIALDFYRGMTIGYALAVQLEDQTHINIDLYAALESQIRAQAQARIHVQTDS